MDMENNTSAIGILETASKKAATSAYIITGTIIFGMNCTVLRCILLWRGLNFGTRLSLVNLAIADLLFGLCILLLGFNNLITRNTQLPCLVIYSITVVTGTVSVTGIMLLSINIFIIMRHCHNTTLPQHRKTFKAALAGAWLISISFAGWYVLDFVYKEKGIVICSFSVQRVLTQPMVTIYALIIIEMTVSIGLLISTAFTAWIRIRKIKREITPENYGLTQVRLLKIQYNMKIAKVAMAVCALFAISWGPWSIVLFTYGVKNQDLPSWIITVIRFTMPLNSIGNVFIYRYRSSHFRQLLNDLICFCKNNTTVHPDPENNVDNGNIVQTL